MIYTAAIGFTKVELQELQEILWSENLIKYDFNLLKSYNILKFIFSDYISDDNIRKYITSILFETSNNIAVNMSFFIKRKQINISNIIFEEYLLDKDILKEKGFNSTFAFINAKKLYY